MVGGGCSGGVGSGRPPHAGAGWCRRGRRSTRGLERSTLPLVWGRWGALCGVSRGCRKLSSSIGDPSEGGVFVSFGRAVWLSSAAVGGRLYD